MPVSENMLFESMYLNSEAPFFDCSKFKTLIQGRKQKTGIIQRLNAWCNEFTASKKKEIYLELESIKQINRHLA